MFSALMMFIIFLEIFVAVVASLAAVTVVRKYYKDNRIQDFYVFIVLIGAAFAVSGMIVSQIMFNLQLPFADLGVKFFFYSVIVTCVFIWFHVSNIYDYRSKILTVIILALSSCSIYLIGSSTVNMIYNNGIIIPLGTGSRFAVGFGLLTIFIFVESLFSVKGIKKLEEHKVRRYNISKTAGGLFGMFLLCLFLYIITNIAYFYIFMWLFAFMALLYLFLFSMIEEESPLIDNPLRYFKTRILFKLVITLTILTVLSLEGIAMISIGISKKALSESVIESYQRVAEDTIKLINKSDIRRGSERETLNAIAEILEVTKVGDRGSVFLVSPYRNVYINRANRWISLGESKSPAIKKLYFGEVGGGEITIFDEKIIAAYIPIKKLGWGMIVGQPIDYAYSRIKQMEATSLIFVMVWIVLTTIVGIILARTIEDPIREVKKGITKIGAGDLGYKINIKNIDEIGELATAFNKVTTELKDSQDSLLRAERLTSLGYMAAGMAHEIKNALVPLRTLTELLQISGKDEAFIKKFNELVPQEIDRIDKLSMELLHYSKPSSAMFAYLNINEIANEAEKYLTIQARKKSVAIHLDLASLAKIKIDRQKMLQVFTNLMLNSIEAMEDKGGNIFIRTRDKDDHVVIEIEDDGPGIPEDMLKRVFVPFYTSKEEGTGMGLPFVQRNIDEHGGKVEIASAEGKGTKFTIALPLIKF